MSEPFIGQLALFPYSFAPKGWADCIGQILPISQNTALFSLLGTTYGGNGMTTFQLPDLQGRAALGAGTSASGTEYYIGDVAGTESVTLTGAEMPSHAHTLNATQEPGTVNTPAGNILASVFLGDLSGGNQGDIYNAGRPNTTLQPASIGLAGGTGAHTNMQPSLTLRYCIAMSGIFPPRS